MHVNYTFCAILTHGIEVLENIVTVVFFLCTLRHFMLLGAILVNSTISTEVTWQFISKQLCQFTISSLVLENRFFVVAMCFENQPRCCRLQTMNYKYCFSKLLRLFPQLIQMYTKFTNISSCIFGKFSSIFRPNLAIVLILRCSFELW